MAVFFIFKWPNTVRLEKSTKPVAIVIHDKKTYGSVCSFYERMVKYQHGHTNALQGKYGDICGTPVDAGGILQ